MKATLKAVANRVWLTKQAEQAERLAPEQRRSLASALTAVQNDARAAGLLMRQGFTPAALRVQRAALEALSLAENEFLAATELTFAETDRAAEAERDASAAEILRAGARDIRRRVSRLSPYARSPSEIRRLRAVGVALVAALVVLIPTALIRRLTRPTVTASSYFRNVDFLGPAMAIDGDLTTEWILENAQAGWLEVKLFRQSIHEVRWVNAKNIAADPRGVREFQIDLLDGAQVVATSSGSVDFSANPSWVVVPLSAARVDRIRFTVKSFYNTGGGLAEIDWR
ncbi:MAG TPA: hypothetical protein VHM70_20890 [Polyangiaceae bacterium]|jgi:hypothetical protein|nr:hypothetical protein [Polyangiaceae bacterium]